MMQATNDFYNPPATIPKQRRRWKRFTAVLAAILLVYFLMAYVALPLLWRRYKHRHPWLDAVPGITETRSGIPSDPLNVALVGTEAEVKGIMSAAGWRPADPLGLRSDLKIAADTILERPDDDAPVSNLYLFGRREDLAFEQPVGDDPRRRHHVRYWRSDQEDPSDRPGWVGSVTYDERVGLSYTTGQITHHIEPNVDAERDRLFQQLEKTGHLAETVIVNDFHKVRKGRNGGGDPWWTDGRLFLGIIKSAP